MNDVSNNRPLPAASPRGARPAVLAFATVISLAASVGCGPDFGRFLYFFGNTPKQTVKARFKLTTDTLLILFDDSPAVDLPPEMRDEVVRALIDEFKQTGINNKVVPLSRLNELRRNHPDVDKRGIREVGRMAFAEQVLWLYPKEFSMAGAPEQALDPAKLTVILKVIDARATDRTRVRLWPVSEEGELVSITIEPNQVRTAKASDELFRTMARQLAAEIGHLFRDYDEGRPEDK
jgi:hypothetical protein